MKVLNNEFPDRSTLFKFALNDRLHKYFVDDKYSDYNNELGKMKFLISTFINAVYVYANVRTPNFNIADWELQEGKYISQYERSQNKPAPVLKTMI